MTTQRLTAISIANLKAAHSIEIQPIHDGGCAVRVTRGSRSAFLHGSLTAMYYPTQEAARRAVKRVRPDLEPTTFNFSV